MIHGRRQTNELVNCSSVLPGGYFQTSTQQEGTQTESEGLAVGLWEAKGLEFVEQSIKEKEVAQKKL